MPSSCRISSLIPSGFVVDSETHIDDEIVLTVRAEAIFAPCPICAAPSRRIHSRYIRHVSDLPASGRLVRLHIVTRRFLLRGTTVSKTDIRRALRRDRASRSLAQNRPARRSRSSSRPCEGFGIDTGRRRRGVFDACVPSIAAFCDCKVWGETTPAGSLRHVFFGLPADVEAAHFLYDLIGVTFDTETARFKTGTIYASLETGERRNAVNSFQTGLSHGIGGKLKAMKAERDTSNRTSSGRDLVPLKTSVIDDELAKLGLSFHAASRGRRKRVLADAYEAGQIAGYQFKVRAGIDVANAN